MRWLFPALAALALIAAKPVHIEQATTSVRVAVVLPHGYPESFISLAAACDEVRFWLSRVQSWYADPIKAIGQTFDYDLTCYESQYDLFQLSGNQLSPCPAAPFGYQGSGNSYTISLVSGELGWLDGNPQRLWVVQIGGGGWAGGRYPEHPANVGWLLLGDWELYQSLYGTQAPCSPSVFDDPRGNSFGYETLNAMGVIEPHGFLNSTLDARQKRQLGGSLNRPFLRDP